MGLINVYDSNGQEINLSVFGLKGLKLHIPSPSYRTVIQEIDGRCGVTVVERILNPRNLVAEFFSKAMDYEDSLVLRDKLYEVLGNGNVLYVSESKQPTKRWKVYFDEWTPERINQRVHSFEIPLIAESGTSESINLVEKTFTTSIFRLKNEGIKLIDPRIHSETEIEFTGASSNLIIRNLTTGDEWSWNGETVEGDTVLLKGVRSLKNNVSIFGQTNKKLITLLPGWNDFEVIGATGGFELTIRSRFYFL